MDHGIAYYDQKIAELESERAFEMSIRAPRAVIVDIDADIARARFLRSCFAGSVDTELDFEMSDEN